MLTLSAIVASISGVWAVLVSALAAARKFTSGLWFVGVELMFLLMTHPFSVAGLFALVAGAAWIVPDEPRWGHAITAVLAAAAVIWYGWDWDKRIVRLVVSVAMLGQCPRVQSALRAVWPAAPQPAIRPIPLRPDDWSVAKAVAGPSPVGNSPGSRFVWAVYPGIGWGWVEKSLVRAPITPFK